MPANTSVRVREQDREALSRRAKQEGRSIPEVIHDLLERERERELLDGAERAWRRLAEDPEALAEWNTEVRAWDATLLDGLEDLE